MKYLSLYVLFFILFVFFSCKKKQDPANTIENSTLNTASISLTDSQLGVVESLIDPTAKDLLKKWIIALNETKTEQDFLRLWTFSDEFSTGFDKRMEYALGKINTDTLPDFFSMQSVLPGYKLSVVGEGTSYQIYKDFKYWKQTAGKTIGNADDDFVEVCMAFYAEDSIESVFPSFMLQTSDYGGSSYLGRGVHKDLLLKINAALSRSNLFEKEYKILKKSVLDDISTSQSYWEGLPKIEKEIEEILSSGIPVLSESDKIQLKTRREILKNYAKNNIKVNLFEGE